MMTGYLKALDLGPSAESLDLQSLASFAGVPTWCCYELFFKNGQSGATAYYIHYGV